MKVKFIEKYNMSVGTALVIESNSVLKIGDIDMHHKIKLAEIRRDLYDFKRRGIQQEAGEIY